MTVKDIPPFTLWSDGARAAINLVAAKASHRNSKFFADYFAACRDLLRAELLDGEHVGAVLQPRAERLITCFAYEAAELSAPPDVRNKKPLSFYMGLYDD